MRAMKNGFCPKCNGREIVHFLSRSHRGYLAFSMWRSAPLTDYVCVTCGLVESYVESVRDRERIRKALM
jgi:hypothetical protein